MRRLSSRPVPERPPVESWVIMPRTCRCGFDLLLGRDRHRGVSFLPGSEPVIATVMMQGLAMGALP
jgi:hypothetical protein